MSTFTVDRLTTSTRNVDGWEERKKRRKRLDRIGVSVKCNDVVKSTCCTTAKIKRLHFSLLNGEGSLNGMCFFFWLIYIKPKEKNFEKTFDKTKSYPNALSASSLVSTKLIKVGGTTHRCRSKISQHPRTSLHSLPGTKFPVNVRPFTWVIFAHAPYINWQRENRWKDAGQLQWKMSLPNINACWLSERGREDHGKLGMVHYRYANGRSCGP